jgi:hypothetical protein
MTVARFVSGIQPGLHSPQSNSKRIVTALDEVLANSDQRLLSGSGGSLASTAAMIALAA